MTSEKLALLKFTAWKLPVFGLTLVRILQNSDGEILHISPYSVQMRENTDQNNSEYGHFLHSYSYLEHCQKSPL